MSELFEVRLSGPEWQYLQSDSVLPSDLQDIVTTAGALSGGAYLLRIPEQRMEEFGDALTDRLAETGFV